MTRRTSGMRRLGAPALLVLAGTLLGMNLPQETDMDLGTFSISLTVADIAASRAFYEAMGFEAVDGNQDDNWLILRNGEAKIGLFQGMFDQNVVTFNPPDVRAVQRAMKAAGLEFVLEADETSTGPAHATLLDPDGNPVLLDQHGP
jgi:catechol 2,3-dioxygenase-like lactoylglutathione lyase family enzyme